MRDVDFLFVYDVKNREFENISLLGAELERRGYKVGFQSFWHSYTHRFYTKYRTKVAVLATCYKDTVYRTFTGFVSAFDKVVNLQWEQVPPNNVLEGETPEQWANADWNSSGVLQHNVRYVSWGEQNRKRLLNVVGVEPANVTVTGYVTLDFYRWPLNNMLISRDKLFARYGLDPKKRTALFISSFVFAKMPKLNSVSPLMTDQAIDIFRTASIDSQSAFLTWAKQLLAEPDAENVQIIYRPHPSEMKNPELQAMQRTTRGFFCIPDEAIKHWLNACDVIYNWNSTSAIEAYFSGKPTFVIRPVFMPRSSAMPIFNNCSFVRTFEEFRQTLYYGDDPQVQAQYSMDINLLNEWYSVGETPAYIRVCDMLEQTIKDDGFHSPVLETRPHLLYYRGNIERISGVLIKHVLANHVANPLRYWLAYRLRGNLRYVWPRRIRMWLRAGKRWLLQLQGGKQAQNRYLAIKNELQADRQESRSLNERRREEKKAIRRQTDELVGMLKNALFSEDCVQKRRYDKEKARQHLIRSSQLKREKARMRQCLNARAEADKLE